MLRQTSYLEVRLSHIKHNIDLIRKHYAPRATLIPMVKGDAYGNGLERVAGYMHDHCDVHHFGVASLGEGLAILSANKANVDTGRNNKVVVFSDTEVMNESIHQVYKEQNAKAAAAPGSSGGAAQLWPVLGTRDQLEMFCRHRTTTFKNTPLLLKLNTGMNRLGLSRSELEDVVPLLKAAGGVDVMLQHFAVSGLVDHSFTTKAYDGFLESRAYLQGAGVEVRQTSVANSGAIEQGIGVEETFVRPGLMLYGPTSLARVTIRPEELSQYRLWDGKACGFLYTKVLRHYVAKAGSYIGYGITRNLVTEDSVIVLLPLGYADGFLRYYTNMPVVVSPAPPHGRERSSNVLEAAGAGAGDASTALSHGITGYVHGNVNMDMVAIRVDPNEVGMDIDTIMRTIKDESEVLVWGNDVASKAEAVKSIPYQLMCALSSRVPRRYVE